MNNIENEARFERIYKAFITRQGANSLYEWLKSSDFFIAPASSKFHCAYEGGLCEHSINVYNNLKMLYEKEKELHPEKMKGITDESIAICGLLHDLCKIDFYKIDFRNVKNAFGQWEKVPYYTIDEKLPMGHGEKSVYLINKYLRLTEDEAIAVNWHMGGFDKRVIGGDHSISDAYEKCPIAVLLQAADLLSSYIEEIR